MQLLRKASWSLLVPIIVVAGFGASLVAQGAAMGKAEQQVMQAEKDRFAAMVKVDEAALNRLLSDDLTYTHSSALFQNKSQFIADLKAGQIKYVSVSPSEPDWKIRIIGNVAVVNGLADVHVVDHGKDLTFKIRYTNVHTNRSGAWQMMAWEATRLPQ
jgi:hypothetical protein